MVATHWIGIFAAIPAFLGGFALMKSDYAPIGFVAVVGGVLLMGLLQTFLVPLTRAEA
jgi:cytochrome b subunit of formate dehydrogenase